MKYFLIRIAFFILSVFAFLNAIKILNIPINWPWLLLFAITLIFWIFWEKIYRKNNLDYPAIVGSFFILQLYADTLGNAFGMYNKFYWFDKVTHFTGGIMAGALTFFFLSYWNKKYNWKMSLNFLIILTILIALALGTLYELWEYFAYDVLGYKMLIIGQTENVDDLLYDLVGTLFFAIPLFYILKKKDYFLPSSIDSKTK